MGLPDFFAQTQGTPIVWGEAGASGVTKTLSFDALAAGSAIMGASADLGADFDQEYLLILMCESGTAPTAGSGSVDGYLAWSHDNSTWPAGVTGSAGSWPADGNEDEWALQLGRPAISLIPTNDGNTLQVQNGVRIRPRARYVAPVVDNNWSHALRDEATATNNDSRLILVPIRQQVIDS